MLADKLRSATVSEAPTLEFITSASRASSDNTSTVVAPAGIEAGDLLVFTDFVPNQISGTVPTGFTQLVLTEASAVDHRTSYKIANGTESGTTITGMTGSDHACILAVFRGIITAITTGTWNSEGTDENPVSQTVTPPTDSQVLVLYAAGSRSSSAPAFTSESPAFDAKISVNSASDGLVLAYSIYQASAVEHTADVGDTGSRNTFHSGYLAGS